MRNHSYFFDFYHNSISNIRLDKRTFEGATLELFYTAEDGASPYIAKTKYILIIE